MKTALIIHGAYGNPHENWIPWVSDHLRDLGYQVITPDFPTPEGQNLENWLNIARPFLDDLNNQSIIIGHSIGATFILSLLEILKIPINKTCLVSGFVGPIGDPDFDLINKSFAEKNFNWEKIRNSSNNFYLFHGDNDPYVPLEKSRQLAVNLDVEVYVVKNGGHLNQSAGFLEFSQLLNVL